MGRMWQGVCPCIGACIHKLHMGCTHGVHDHGHLHVNGRMGDGTRSPAPLTCPTDGLYHSPAPPRRAASRC